MSDDSLDFKASQRAHGDKIRTERSIMDMYGVSRSQARSVLKGLQQFQQRIETARAAQGIVTTAPAPTQIQVAETTLPSPKLGSGDPGSVGGGLAAPATPTGDVIRVLLNVGGSAVEADLVGEFV